MDNMMLHRRSVPLEIFRMAFFLVTKKRDIDIQICSYKYLEGEITVTVTILVPGLKVIGGTKAYKIMNLVI